LLSRRAADIPVFPGKTEQEMETPPATLDRIRRQIDALDDTIHDALMARARLAAEVRAAKGAEGPTLRPGREANVVRRLVARHAGSMPASVVVRIWREIMTANSRLQGPFAIAVATGAAGGQGIELARDHFGTLTTLQPVGSAARALSALAEGRAQIALVPLPGDTPEDPWWRGLGAGPAPQLNVVARVPFAPDRRGGAALLVGRQTFDASGQDRGFAIVETRAELSQTRLTAIFGKAGLTVIGLPAAHDDPSGGSLQLVELSAHPEPGDARLALVAAALGEGALIRPVGGYAVPLDLGRG
jgi:chorismate mutase